jgi:hypothetical protein
MDGYVLRRAPTMLKQVGIAEVAARLIDFEIETGGR